VICSGRTASPVARGRPNAADSAVVWPQALSLQSLREFRHRKGQHGKRGGYRRNNQIALVTPMTVTA